MNHFKQFFSFILPEDITSDDIIIVVIGPSGAGKSTFINTAIKGKLKVNHGLKPCTTKVKHVRFTYQNEDSTKKLVFVDTPAYPCDNTEAGLIVEMKIQDWARDFTKRNKITGILYLHKITDNRLTQPPHKQYEMFRRLFGENFHTRVLLVTTMWRKLSNQNVGEKRNGELRRQWSEMIDKGSDIVSHDGEKESAWSVIEKLLAL